MKLGVNTNTNNKKVEQSNSKSVTKTSNNNNFLQQSGKDVKKILLADPRKSDSKMTGTNKNILASSVGSSNNQLGTFAKANYKSTPVTKTINLNLNDENSGKPISIKDNFNSTKINETKNLLESNSNYNSSNGSKKVTNNLNIQSSSNKNNNNINNTNSISSHPKNAHVNLWRKPVIIGSANLNVVQSQHINQECQKSKQKTSGQNNNNILVKTNNVNLNNNNITNTYSNIMSTNFTDNKKEDKEYTMEIGLQTASPINNFIETPKNRDNMKFQNNTSRIYDKKERSISPYNKNLNSSHNITNNPVNNINANYQTNYNTNINFSNHTNNMNPQYDILSSIINLKSLIKSNERTNNFEKLFQSEENIHKIKDLNLKLNKYGGSITNNNNNIAYNNVPQYQNASLNLHESFNSSMIRQDENQHKNINVINADMLNDYNLKPTVVKSTINRRIKDEKMKDDDHTTTRISINSNKFKNNSVINKQSSHHNKNKVELEPKENKNFFNEIYANSNLRIKRYEILIDFINNNLKEINQIMNNSTILNNNPHNSGSHIDISKEFKKVDEVNSKLSSLHSKINLNSKTNINIDKDIINYDNSQIDGKNEIIFTKGQFYDESYLNLHIDINKEEINKERFDLYKHKKQLSQIEPSPSFLISSFNSDFYQNLLDDTILNKVVNNQTFLNISNDMNSFRTPNDPILKLDKMISTENDKKIPLHFSNKRFSVNNNTDIISNNLNKFKHNNERNNLGSSRYKETIPNVHSPIQNPKKDPNDSDTIVYNDGEENVVDSDLDKTLENIQINSPKKANDNMVAKDIERVKFFSHKNATKTIETNFQQDIKEIKSSKSPEEKSSKCFIY